MFQKDVRLRPKRRMSRLSWCDEGQGRDVDGLCNRLPTSVRSPATSWLRRAGLRRAAFPGKRSANLGCASRSCARYRPPNGSAATSCRYRELIRKLRCDRKRCPSVSASPSTPSFSHQGQSERECCASSNLAHVHEVRRFAGCRLRLTSNWPHVPLKGSGHSRGRPSLIAQKPSLDVAGRNNAGFSNVIQCRPIGKPWYYRRPAQRISFQSPARSLPLRRAQAGTAAKR